MAVPRTRHGRAGRTIRRADGTERVGQIDAAALLGCTDLDLRLTTAGVAVVVVAIWLGLVIAFGVPASPQVLLAALLAAAAVIRTATRPAIDYGNVGTTVTPDGNLVPFGLVVQLARGPEVLIIGLLVANSGFEPNVRTLICLGIAAFGFAR